MIHYVAIFLVFLSIALGIVFVPFSLPGTWIITLTGVTYSLFYPFDGGASSALKVNAILVGLAIFGEVMEFFVGTFGNKPLRVSNGAIVSAFIGGIIGAMIGVPVFLVGSLIGLFLGAFLGAFLYEVILLKSISRAFISACAVLATRLVASVLKTTLAVGMGVYLGFKIF